MGLPDPSSRGTFSSASGNILEGPDCQRSLRFASVEEYYLTGGPLSSRVSQHPVADP